MAGLTAGLLLPLCMYVCMYVSIYLSITNSYRGPDYQKLIQLRWTKLNLTEPKRIPGPNKKGKQKRAEWGHFLSAEAMSFRVLNGGGSGQSGAGPDIDSVLAEAADDDVPF